ncbi:hypothetical protein TNCV_4909771 [Trichonephila clavipes]|uniref:Uncharacterized protein n=1 Tax=Trichonephila clavipes TaxID=2585209 RepID=A0A8X6RT15_TRICX|nr:hypothetical protein TNCV_4909771 [Trichonephila clavipes]
MTGPRPAGKMRRASSSQYSFITLFIIYNLTWRTFCRATGCYQIQHRSEETPAKSFLSMRSASLNRRLISGVWTVNSPQSHIVRVYDAGHGKSGVFHSAEWHDGDWSSDGIREAWLWFFIWVESF